MKRAVNPSISADSVGSEPTARRVTDQIDPYALIDRAERLLNTNPHDAVMFALRAQSVARARGAEALMARAHYVAGAALTQTGDWSGAIRQLSHAEHIYRAQNDIASQCQVIMLVLMSAGNLAVTQAVRQIVCERVSPGEPSVWNAKSMYQAVRILGDAIREVHKRDAAYLKEFGIEFNANFILGGQIRGEGLRLFQLYSAGNFIEATSENPYLQIGEARYGKPIIDRVIQPNTPLDEAAKCALISMDSTLRSNISVGLPLDLLVYENESLRVTKFVQIDGSNQYMRRLCRNDSPRRGGIITE